MTAIDLGFGQELHRLAAYQYLEPWIRGRRVLEIGCGAGQGLRQLFALGARAVVGVDRDLRSARTRVSALEETVTLRTFRPPRLDVGDALFDLVVVSDARDLWTWPPLLDELRRVAAPGAVCVVRAESGDLAAATRGVSYGDLLDLLEPRFAAVRVLGQSSFVGYSLVELTEEDAAEPELTLDAALMGGGAEEVGAYLVLCGAPEALRGETPYGIVQVPSDGEPALERWWDSLADAAPAEEAEEAEEATLDTSPAQETSAPAEPTAPSTAPSTAPPAAEPPPPEAPAPVTADDPVARTTALQAFTEAEGGLVPRWRWPQDPSRPSGSR